MNLHDDYDSRLHRQKHRQNDERGRLPRDDISCRQEWVPPSGGGRMDDWRHFHADWRDSRHFLHAPLDERAFGRNESVLGPRDSAFIPANAPYHYPRDVQMQDLQHVRGGAREHYNDRGGKCGGDEERVGERDRYNERGRERDRYNERDRNRGWQCDAYRGRDSRDRNDRNNERDGNKDFQRSRDSDRDRDRDRGSDRDRQYTITQRPSKQFNRQYIASS